MAWSFTDVCLFEQGHIAANLYLYVVLLDFTTENSYPIKKNNTLFWNHLKLT